MQPVSPGFIRQQQVPEHFFCRIRPLIRENCKKTMIFIRKNFHFSELSPTFAKTLIMILSMTGYGRAEGMAGNRQVTVEIKSVNGKQFDITNRINPLLRAYEAELRNELQKQLNRGSVDVTITIRQDGSAKPMQVNTTLAKMYFQAVRDIAGDLNLDIENSQPELISTIMRMPEVVAPEQDSLPEAEWQQIKILVDRATAQLTQFRATEGKALEADLLERIANIQSLLKDVEQYEPQRIERIRSRIQEALSQVKERTDENRFEQELIYYIEKIDFSEEKQRLRQHCDYYNQIIAQAKDGEGLGKKLGFVLQEVGREINTLGSKANDADIQQIVVNMKDELEKAKEQVLNVL